MTIVSNMDSMKPIKIPKLPVRNLLALKGRMLTGSGLHEKSKKAIRQQEKIALKKSLDKL